jgi:tetratricopeptide (TPR) repeat protein
MQAIQRAHWLIAAFVTAGLLGAASLTEAQAIGAPPPGSLQDASDNRRPRAPGLRPPKVTVSPQAHARAAELTSQAQAQYDSGRYEEASESYRKAYAVVPAPELLFNLGQCQRLLGRSERALKYFEAYLRLRPDAPHRPLVEQLIEESKLIGPSPDSALHSARQEPPAISAAPAGTQAELPHRARHANVMPLPPPEPLAESQPPPTRLLADDRYSEHESPAVYERWWFWTAIAVVAAGAAVTTYAVVSDQENDEPQAMTTLGTIAWD